MKGKTMQQSNPSVIEQLQREHSQETNRIDKLQRDLKSSKRRCRKLADAIKILCEDELGLTQEHVRPLVKQLLEDNPTLEADAIYGLVQEKLSENNLPAKGLGLRMKEILAESWITEIQTGVFALSSRHAG